LIKSILRQSALLSAEQLGRDGVVDQAFPAMLKDAGVATFLLGRGDQQAFIAALARAEDCGAALG
jgi:hypothetical protein